MTDVKLEMKRSLKQKSLCHTTTLRIYLLLTLFLILIIFSGQAFQSPFSSSSTSTSTSTLWSFLQKWKKFLGTTHHLNCSRKLETMTSKLRDSVTFLPLKDLRFENTAIEGHTWFMSSLNDIYEDDEVEYLYFPSEASQGRLLCILGRDSQDGGNNSYGLAWSESLPDTATLMEGLTFVSDTYYDYDNLWHGLSAMAPFVGWSKRKGCLLPTRWVLFHWGELRIKMGSWLSSLMEANFGGEAKVEEFERGGGPFCFEKAVVMRHNVGKMGMEKRLEVYDLLRCKARLFCDVSLEGKGVEISERGVPVIRLTLLMRRGARSFKNETAVVDVFKRECARMEGCRLMVARSENLSFCDQVRLMSYTDIVASPHGAQLTNMIFMDRKSSVMEFFPKGWWELAGAGKYAHHWMANQSGMRHQGAWWDPLGEIECPYPREDPRCFLFYKDGKVGHNETFFAEWTRKVINQVMISKLQEASKSPGTKLRMNSSVCACA